MRHDLEMGGCIEASTVVEGRGAGALLLLDAPLSFWGGLDARSGHIIEPGHPQQGRSLAGRVVLMERAKGSSSSSSVLAEAIRHGSGPAALVMRERDLIVGLGCIVASELYGIQVPIVGVDATVWQHLIGLAPDTRLEVEADRARAQIRLGTPGPAAS